MWHEGGLPKSTESQIRHEKGRSNTEKIAGVTRKKMILLDTDLKIIWTIKK